MKIIFTLRNDGDFAQRFKRDKKITFIFLGMKSTNYYMEYCYRSSWIKDRLNNDSSRNWILTKLSDHIRIPFSYFNASLGGLWARIKRLIHFGVHVDGCVIWTWQYQLIEILWMALKHFPRYFGQGRKKRIIIRSTKISYMYLRVYIYIYIYLWKKESW